MMRIIIMALGALTALGAYLTKYIIQTIRPLNISRWAKVIPTAMSIATVALSGVATWNAVSGGTEQYLMLVPSSGVTVMGNVSLGIYWDVTGTRAVTEVDWGVFELCPNAAPISNNVKIWVRNNGNRELYVSVTWDDTSWQPPEAMQYFELTFGSDPNFLNSPLKPNRARELYLYLKLDPSITDIESFSFDILIIGQDEPFTETYELAEVERYYEGP